MMERIEAHIVTNTTHKKLQKKWFEREGITYKIDVKNNVYTTDDWMNGKDKYQAQNVIEDDGFNLESLDYAPENEWFSNNIDRLPKSEKEIIEQTIEDPHLGNFHCVYFLFANGEIIYVGKCKNIRKRINNHRSLDKIKFDTFRIISDVDYEDLVMIESFYINLLRPENNDYFPPLCKVGKIIVDQVWGE